MSSNGISTYHSPAFLCHLLASRRLLRVHVCRVRQHAPQAAPPDQMCHPVSPGRLLSQRCVPAASATFNEEISITGPRGDAVLTGGMEARHRGNQETWTNVSSPQTLFLPLRVTLAVILPLSRQPACQMITTRRDGFSSTGLLTSCLITRRMLKDSQLHSNCCDQSEPALFVHDQVSNPILQPLDVKTS